jgi:hypothetical protein
MPLLQIKRQCNTTVDPKQVLRAHIDQLPLYKQREFVATAFQLIAERTGMSDAEIRASYQQARHDVQQ